MNKNLFLIIILLTFFSCTWIKEPEAPLAHMKATVNGTVWKSESLDNPHIQIDNSYGDMNVVWYLPTGAIPNSSPTFYISMYHPITPGKYTFNNTGNSTPQKGVAVFIQGWAAGNYIGYYSTSGYVDIIYNDEVYMEGTFKVTVKDNANDSIEFTNGEFKAYITGITG